MIFEEVTGDLFTAPEDFALVHCISADAKMGAGIAKEFRKRYLSMVHTLENKKPLCVGDCEAVIVQDGRTILNLVTKSNYWNKPTYDSLRASLKDMSHFLNLNDHYISYIAMPLIGCGLDQLEWSQVKEIIHQELNHLDVHIRVYHLEPRILECSSKGDRRFSAFYAKVSSFGKVASIEEHYQLCKRFRTPYDTMVPKTTKEAKGKTPTHIELNGVEYDIGYLTLYYKGLWMAYLDQHPELVEYAKQFDDYSDIFKGKSINCQADVIRQYIKEGRESIQQEVQPLVDAVIRNIKR